MEKKNIQELNDIENRFDILLVKLTECAARSQDKKDDEEEAFYIRIAEWYCNDWSKMNFEQKKTAIPLMEADVRKWGFWSFMP